MPMVAITLVARSEEKQRTALQSSYDVGTNAPPTELK